MKAMLKKTTTVGIYHFVNGVRIAGAPSGLRGDVTDLRGDVTGLRGDVTDLWGNVSGLCGDVSGLRGDVTGLRGDVSGLWGDVTGLRGDGTLWLNLGDSYSSGGQGGSSRNVVGPGRAHKGWKQVPGLKPKNLIGIPWRVAFALQADGWYLRQDIIWGKPNPMPESVTDRCTKAHEYVFLLSKSPRYYYGAEEMREPAVGQNAHDVTGQGYSAPGQSPHTGSRGQRDNFRRARSKRTQAIPGQSAGTHRPDRPNSGCDLYTRNIRSVWSIPTMPFKAAHFAVFPPALAERCIKAGCPAGGTVLDPFTGSGTCWLVAAQLGRSFVGVELNPSYVRMARKRVMESAGLLASAPAALPLLAGEDK